MTFYCSDILNKWYGIAFLGQGDTLESAEMAAPSEDTAGSNLQGAAQSSSTHSDQAAREKKKKKVLSVICYYTQGIAHKVKARKFLLCLAMV